MYLYSNPAREYTFDFRGKRVKENGKVMSKFSMAYTVQSFNFYRGLYLDSLSYDDCKQTLLTELEQKQFTNVTIIK